MAGQSRIYKLNILADTKGLTDGLNKANQQVGNASGSIGSAFKKIGVAVAAAGAAAGAFAVKLGVDAIKAASNLNETVSKVGQIFGSSAKQVEAFANTAATSLGQSRQQALDASATFAVFGKAAGLAGSDLVDFSTDFTVLASDLASFNNTSPEQAIQAIGSALRGEAEPLRSYGVLLNDATLKQAALELGIISTTTQALTPQQKVLAAQKVIYEQTSDAQGDFGRTSDGLANQSKILKARLEDISAEIGTALLPIVTDLATFFGDEVIPVIEKFGNFLTQDLIPQIRAYTIPAIEDFIDSVKGLSSAFGTVQVEAEKTEFSLSELAFGTEGLVTTTINSGSIIVKVWGTILDAANRLRAFISGDMDTAFKEFENRFIENDKAVNNVNDSMVKAYTQFGFYNNRTQKETIPLTIEQNKGFKETGEQLDKTNQSARQFIGSQNSLASSTKAVTQALKEQFSVMQSLDLMRAGFSGAVGGVVQQGSATLKPQLPGGESFRSAGELVSQFGGLIPGFNAKPGDPYFGFGKGDDLRSFKPAAAGSTSTTNVTINVNGTVIDPEGAARAVASVISNSAGRAGPVALNPVLAVQ
jgi:hypothetical protein